MTSSALRRAWSWRAPAKVNLTLRILGRRGDGLHELESIVAFAGCCDHVFFEPGPEVSLRVDGANADASGSVGNNLILRAVSELAARSPGLATGAFRLQKQLPVAAGLGGGSSDAAAALRALAAANGMSISDTRVVKAARATGADVPVCLLPRARMMSGIGDLVGPGLDLPPTPAVLVNPGLEVATRDVFARLGLARGQNSNQKPASPGRGFLDLANLVEAVQQDGNDLRNAAESIAPEIGAVIDALSGAPGVLAAGMSGSGATCFALFSDRHLAAASARSLSASQPNWWVRPTLLR
jgi:4-diphosphocytidyl-2-C-methyl-D-erythritol kinase